MKPDIEQPGATPMGTRRRRVRLLVALLLGAVGAIYAVALVAGGGFAGPPIPPLTMAMATPPAAAAAQAPVEAVPIARPVAPAPLSEWTQRAEIQAPWESR